MTEPYIYRARIAGGSNAGRTANKSRENLRAILSWAWEQDFLEKLPRFPKPKPQRDVAGRHYLTKADLNALYFATYELERPRGWKQPLTVGHYGGTSVWCPEPPNGQSKGSRYGWLYYRRVETKKQFYRPMHRVVKVHLKSLRPDDVEPDQPVFDCGTSRPNTHFQRLCTLAGVKPKQDVASGEEKKWVLKDLRKAYSYYDTSLRMDYLKGNSDCWGFD